MSAPRDKWVDREAGPVVRPYAMTRGRTMPASDAFVGMIDMVVAQDYRFIAPDARLNADHRRLLSRCQQPVTVVDLASDANLPVGVIRVLLSDLVQWGAAQVTQAPRGHVTDEGLLRDVLNGLRAL